MRYYDFSSNRVLCTVLDEMRKMHETRNYSGLLGSIEEAQAMGNRMESALYDKKDLTRAREEVKKLKDEIKLLLEEKNKLNKELGKEVTNESVY